MIVNKKYKKCTSKRITALLMALMMGISLTSVNETVAFATDLEETETNSEDVDNVIVEGEEGENQDSQGSDLQDGSEDPVEDVPAADQPATIAEEEEYTGAEAQPSNLITESNMTIDKDGTYQLEEGLSGEIVIGVDVKNVTIVGNGAEWDKDTTSATYGAVTSSAHEGLKFDCTAAPGITLTLRDIFISNSFIGDNTIDFAGTGNTLIFDGTVVIDHDNNAAGYAGIHVKKGDSLTIYGTAGSSMYMYKREQAAGIGANNQEACGNINFGIENGANDFYFFMKGTKQGAVIGNGANCPETPGNITIYSGIYNLEANARGALLGGSAGPSSFDAGNVYIKGGLLNLNVDFSGAAIGGGGFATGNDKEGGNVYFEGGSVRTYIDSNAVSSWSSYGVTEAGVNDVAITANKLNSDGESVYMLAIDTADITADTYTIAVDGETYYTGSRYAYCYCYENTDRDVDNSVYPNGTPGNWISLTSETNLYVYVTGENHKVTVNGTKYQYDWDAENKTFTRHECSYTAGKCECGNVHDNYKWYYECEDDANYIITTAEEFAALADIVNSGADTFVSKTVELTKDIDLSTIENWDAVGGAAENIALTITSQEELQAAIDEYNLVYDNMGNSYKAGTDKNMTYVASYSYYYVEGKIFSGTFDGNGYEIQNLNVNTATGYAGLFGNVNGTLKNFTVNGSVTSTASNDFVGGVAGKLSEGGTISNVTSNVTVTAKKCYNVGGIVGFLGTKTAMTSAENTSIVECINNGDVIGYSQVGGITGENAGQILRCVNNGKVDGVKTGSKNGCGGIAGRNGCNNAVASKGTIIDCYNTGVIGNVNMKWVGGIAGFSNGASIIKNCYNVGTVLGTGQTNPLVGQGEANTSYEGAGVYNSYYLDSTKVYDESGVYGGVQENCGPKTEEEMKSSDFVALLGESFAKDVADINNGYPILKWQRTYTLGDVNDDGSIDAYDSMVIDQYLAGWPSEMNMNAADVNGDGEIDAYDSMYIDQYLAGWPVEF